LGLIEAAEAAAAASASGSGHAGSTGAYDDEHDHADESFNTSEGNSSFLNASSHSLHHPYTAHHQLQSSEYFQQPLHSHLHRQNILIPGITYTSSSSTQQVHHVQSGFSSALVDNAAGPHRVYMQPISGQHAQYANGTHIEGGDAGHQPYTIVYPMYALPPTAHEAGQYIRSPSQSDFPHHVQQHSENVAYTDSVSPIDGSFEQQQQAHYAQPIYSTHIQAQHLRNEEQSVQDTRLLQSVPLVQRPFLAPPSAAQQYHAPSLQRSVSAPIPRAVPFERKHTPQHAHQHVVAMEDSAIQHQMDYSQHSTVGVPRFSARSGYVAQQDNIANDRPASSNGGMTIYIPPSAQTMHGWSIQPRSQAQGQTQTQRQQPHQQQQVTPLAHPSNMYAQNQNLQNGQQPPTPYFYLSVPESTPIAEHQPPVSAILHPVPVHASSHLQQQQQAQHQSRPSFQTVLMPVDTHLETGTVMETAPEPAVVAMTKTKRRKESKKKKAVSEVSMSTTVGTSKTNKKKNASTLKKETKEPNPQNKLSTEEANDKPKPQAVQLTKTYQEAAMQLLALASSSPPPSPVKEYHNPIHNHEDGDNEAEGVRNGRKFSIDGDGSVFAEDSGYAHFQDDDISLPFKNTKSTSLRVYEGNDQGEEAGKGQLDQQEEEDDEKNRSSLRFADVPPSSPAQLRMSLSPESSPLPLAFPSKLSATYLRAQASAGGRSTPIGMKRKHVRGDLRHSQGGGQAENDENAIDERTIEAEHEEEEGERISLDSSPEREDLEMKAPIAKRRLISMSSISPGSRMKRAGDTGGGPRQRQSTSGTSRSPSPSRYTTSAGSSFATSVTMSTPHQHLVGSGSHHHDLSSQQSQPRKQKAALQASSSSLPSGLFSFAENMQIKGGGESDKDVSSGSRRERGGREHKHRSSIFKIDNCSRPSAGLGMIGTSSSPSRPFLLSSPEHAAVSKSLGLVPDNFTSTSLSLPSDSEGFEIHFLRGFNNNNNNNNDGNNAGLGGNSSNGIAKMGRNGGLSEYAKDVFGGFL